MVQTLVTELQTQKIKRISAENKGVPVHNSTFLAAHDLVASALRTFDRRNWFTHSTTAKSD
jgi:hypothetical protein